MWIFGNEKFCAAKNTRDLGVGEHFFDRHFAFSCFDFNENYAAAFFGDDVNFTEMIAMAAVEDFIKFEAQENCGDGFGKNTELVGFFHVWCVKKFHPRNRITRFKDDGLYLAPIGKLLFCSNQKSPLNFVINLSNFLRA